MVRISDILTLDITGPEQANFVLSGHTISFIGVCARTQSRGFWGHAPSGKFQNIHPLKHVFNEILYQNTVQSGRKKQCNVCGNMYLLLLHFSSAFCSLPCNLLFLETYIPTK